MDSYENMVMSSEQRKSIEVILGHARDGDWEQLSQVLDDPNTKAENLEYIFNNPLHEAIVRGHPNIVRRLIDRGYSVEENGVDSYSVKCMTPLHLAARWKQAEITYILLDAGADPTRIDVTDCGRADKHSWSRTPFLEAVYWNAFDVVKILIDRLPSHQISPVQWEQAVGHATANHHANALEVVLSHYPGEIPQKVLDKGLKHVARSSRWDEHEMMIRSEEELWESQIRIFRLLLEKGADPNWKDSSLPVTHSILHTATTTAEGIETIQMLLDHGADIHALDEFGNTLFARAVFNGNIDIVRFYLNRLGPEVNVNERLALVRYYKDGSIYRPPGGSILHVAAYEAPMEVVKLLLDNGADPLAQDDNEVFPFHSACKGGRLETTKLLWNISQTTESTLDLESTTKDGWSPFLLAVMPAIYENDSRLLIFLLEQGADVNQCTPDGWSALHRAAKSQNIACVELLLRHGAKRPHTVDGDTELHLALQSATFQAEEFLEFFLSHGADADISTPNSAGQTPLTFYIYKRGRNAHARIVGLLLKYGADVEIRDSTRKTVKDWGSEKNFMYNWDQQTEE